MIGVSLPTTDDTGLAITSYDIIADVNADLIGTATMGTDLTDAAAISADVFTNLTDASLTVTYTITPYSGDCGGTSFDVIITVDPEPVIAANIEATLCSDEAIGVDLPTADDTGLAITSYDITASVDVDLTGTATTGTDLTDVAAISADIFTNLTDASLTVTYTITPYSEDCEGTSFDVIITVDPEPVVASTQFDATICSGDETGVIIPTADDTGLAITSYDISAIVASGLGGTATEGTGLDVSTADISLDEFTNETSGPLTVTYTITPYTNGCVGSDFTIVVTVNPEPTSIDVDLSICSQTTLNVDLQSLIDNGVASTFTWQTINVSNVFLVEGYSPIGVINTSSTITDMLTNQASIDHTVTYQVNPVSADGCIGDPFNIVVTIFDQVEAAIQLGVGFNIDGSLCENTEGLIQSTAVQGVTPYTYDWSVVGTTGTAAVIFNGGTSTATTQNIIVEGTGNGDVTIQLIVTDDTGCIADPVSQIITILESPADNPITGEAVACTGDLEMYMVTNEPVGSTFTWSLSSGGSIVSSNVGSTVTIEWSNTVGGPHTLTMIETNANGCETVNTFPVTLEDCATVIDLIPSLSMNPSVIFGSGNVNVILDVIEFGGQDTDGSPITIVMAADDQLSFTWDPNATAIGGNVVDNTLWDFDGTSFPGFYIWTTNSNFNILPAGETLTFGMQATFDAQNASGTTPFTMTIGNGSGGEVIFINNSDAETILFFPN